MQEVIITARPGTAPAPPRSVLFLSGSWSVGRSVATDRSTNQLSLTHRIMHAVQTRIEQFRFRRRDATYRMSFRFWSRRRRLALTAGRSAKTYGPMEGSRDLETAWKASMAAPQTPWKWQEWLTHHIVKCSMRYLWVSTDVVKTENFTKIAIHKSAE